jgi:hypothetical protein
VPRAVRHSDREFAQSEAMTVRARTSPVPNSGPRDREHALRIRAIGYDLELPKTVSLGAKTSTADVISGKRVTSRRSSRRRED